MPSQELDLESQEIGNVGMSALAGACAGGALDNLTHLNLGLNQIGDQGIDVLAYFLKSRGGMDNLTVRSATPLPLPTHAPHR